MTWFLALMAADALAAPHDLEEGRALTRAFADGELAGLWKRMAPGMKEAIGGEAALGAFHKGVVAEFGAEVDVLDERAIPNGSARIYMRRARYAAFGRPVVMEWTIDGTGTIVGFYVKPETPPAASKRLEYRTRARLRLPFDGDWHVFWGGRSIWENQHAAAPDQRFAYDFLAARAGRFHHRDGSENEHYFGFGQVILSPAAGVVAAAADGVADNAPGVMNAKKPLGNHVIIDHGNQEFSFLAHLQKGSVAVKKGQRVAAGAQVGRCGNSGHSSAPHLHYHLQTTRVFGFGRKGEGLPASFESYIADEKPVEAGEPTRGQTIRPPSGSRHEVFARNEIVFRAIAARDRIALEGVVAADFRFEAADGTKGDRKAWLDGVAAIPGTIESVTNQSLRLEATGDRATLCGLQRAVVVVEGKRIVDEAPFCDRWERRDGRWLLTFAGVPEKAR